MLRCHEPRGGRLVEGAAPATALWIDLESPTPEEEGQVEAALALDIPTRDELAEIEASSRLYVEDGAAFLTAQVIATDAAGAITLAPLTFVLAGERLVTVHYHAPGSIRWFAERAARHDLGCTSAPATFLALVEAIVDRLADVLEGEARRLEAVGAAVFAAPKGGAGSSALAAVMARIGEAEDRNGKLRESLATLHRMQVFLAAPGEGGKTRVAGLDKGALKTLAQDIASLREVAEAQGQKVLFLLDATLGAISIRQADIIKVFSVVAFVFLPPTLIASIYGMNFEHMPELAEPWGYPAAVAGMAVSAAVPLIVFRLKKWL
jgi:magnesium transporter